MGGSQSVGDFCFGDCCAGWRAPTCPGRDLLDEDSAPNRSYGHLRKPVPRVGSLLRRLRAGRAGCLAQPAAFQSTPPWLPLRLLRSRRLRSAVAPPLSFHVVSHVCAGDGRPRPRDPDGADQKPHGPLLAREGMLDICAHRRFVGISPDLRFAIGLPLGFLRLIRLTLRATSRKSSSAFERYAVSAQTSEAVLLRSISRSRSRAPS